MKKIAMVLIPGMTLMACSNEKAMENKDTTMVKNEARHEHSFACPMHPEVKGKEGDTCPKCGMKLVHSDNASDASNTFFMQFTTSPTAIEPNKAVTLSFTPKKEEAPDEQVALDIEHEKKIHLILVNDDLSWFDHIHPEFNTDGSYQVTAEFPAPGRYKAFADYKPTGGNHVVDKIDINVVGTAPTAKTFTSEKYSGTSDRYQFTLSPLKPLSAGGEMHIWGIVSKDGKEIDVNTLEDYLGAKAHIVVISAEGKDYLHVHPNVKDGRLGIHTNFDKPGIYRGWIQFNGDGKLHTIDFTMNVLEETSPDKQALSKDQKKSEDHSSHHH